jgi:hypothetical protein
MATALTAAAVALQRASGAPTSEFGSHPDEAAHLVTGLMMGEFLRSFDWLDPIGFSADYYMHYPKVAIGHWPPVFYLVQGIWTSVFGSSRQSLLLLMAVVATTLGWLLYRSIRRRTSVWIAAAGAFGFLLLPAVQRYTGSVMAESLVALFAYLAAESYARYLDAPSARRSLLFGVWASLAILTKGNGFALALLPFLAVALSGRWRVVRRWDFYAAALPVVLLCLPFYWLTLSMQQNGWRESSPGVGFALSSAPYYTLELFRQLGPAASVLAVAALIGEAARYRGRWTSTTACMSSLVLSVWAFQVCVPCGLEWRHLVASLAPGVYLAAVGFDEVQRFLLRLAPARAAWVRGGCAALVLSAAAMQFRVPMKQFDGFSPLVERMNAFDQGGDAVWLISSDAVGEGMFIAEAALRQPDPTRVVLRSSKFLASSRWDGRNYHSSLETPEEILAKLEAAPVGYAVVDQTADVANAGPHHEKLLAALQSASDRWELVETRPVERRGSRRQDGALVYRLRGYDPKERQTIQVGMQEMLGGQLEKSGRSRAVWRR